MSEELKPCRRCGNSDLATASYVANNGEIFISVACMKCAECYSIEFWQTDNARESALRAENEQLRRERDALDRYAEALECFYTENQRWGTVSDATDEELGLALAELDAVREERQ